MYPNSIYDVCVAGLSIKFRSHTDLNAKIIDAISDCCMWRKYIRMKLRVGGYFQFTFVGNPLCNLIAENKYTKKLGIFNY